MLEKNLTLRQNICAARIFLNAFGFILDKVDEISELSKIKIYNNSLKYVGDLYFENKKVIIVAKYNHGTLRANYDMVKMTGFIDTEYNNALFGQWETKINFKIANDDNKLISGEFLLISSMDSQYGILCKCHPLINISITGKHNISIKILRDGSFFYSDFHTDNYKEIIDYDAIKGNIYHTTEKQDFNQLKIYKKYIGIFNDSSDEIHIFLEETQNGKTLKYQNKLVKKINKDDIISSSIQKGLLIQKIDDNLLKKLELLREILTIDNISILDNLIFVCYDNYASEEIVALLGTNRANNVYQNNEENLTKAYFEIGKQNSFLSLDQQKRLLKKY